MIFKYLKEVYLSENLLEFVYYFCGIKVICLENR